MSIGVNVLNILSRCHSGRQHCLPITTHLSPFCWHRHKWEVSVWVADVLQSTCCRSVSSRGFLTAWSWWASPTHPPTLILHSGVRFSVLSLKKRSWRNKLNQFLIIQFESTSQLINFHGFRGTRLGMCNLANYYTDYYYRYIPTVSNTIQWNLYNYIKYQPRDQQNVVLIHRWSLYAGSIAWKIYTWGPVKCGLYKQVVFIYRWSLEQVCVYVCYRETFMTFVSYDMHFQFTSIFARAVALLVKVMPGNPQICNLPDKCPSSRHLRSKYCLHCFNNLAVAKKNHLYRQVWPRIPLHARNFINSSEFLYLKGFQLFQNFASRHFSYFTMCMHFNLHFAMSI